MTLDQLIAIIGQVATWITVLFVLLTLREMERQRRESYKPELVVSRERLSLFGNQKGKVTLPIVWSNKTPWAQIHKRLTG